ncbi:MAG: hypothetical protein A3B47_04470 [Candidatus Levybacteria bacterium RIFCSPLOWO2_01_FULL_39_24]|nr:MAG: hypothetical protein A2800_03840 [Candidatus Levybacteria bacterium RIFCSPHIGHO2_01_FULL_40_16]OGH28294.1 MAG: hypothetical protein A3E12_02390 [Candidatus Levybacteria bacterium RIFCSPHIGHO2_12_FULL_39_9]OGH46700.1 MAG: hypothetical protein A3B47_04470 [Candidatus Levybacteria bacterium RIFCSPLOWO2_01_FULL_39_24]
MPTKERPAQCLLGNGECPKSCENYAMSRLITNKLGDNFDPFLSRLRVIFGDGFSRDIRVGDVANALKKCISEKKPSLL